MEELQLSDFCDITMGQSPQGTECNSSGQGVPLLNGPTEFGLISPIPVQWTINPRKFSKPEDLLFCVRGSTTGKMNWSDQRYAIGRGLAAISPRTPSTMHFFKGLIESNLPSLLAGATGSTFPNVSRPDLATIPVQVSDIDYIRSASQVLEGIERKIELNQRMNQTLEDIAKAIFESWFVDFDPVRAKAEGRPTGLPAEISDLFPDTFEDSEIGEIPAGWEVVPFTRTFQFFSGGTPKTSIPEYWNGDIPWFSIADLNGGSPWVVRTEKSITELGLSKCSARLIEKGTTIVTARGTVGKVALAAQDMAINQSCYAMRALEGWSFGWLYLQTLALVDRLKANAHGSVFDTITRETFERFHVLMPCAAIMEIFHDTVTPLFERILCADNENLILSELRDTLLPKLISGELRIPDAEKFLQEAGI